MSERLRDRFEVGDRVDIYFVDSGAWAAGRVEAMDHPGAWVRTEDGRRWFVTNGRRIRRMMEREVAARLLDLNRVFYEQFAGPFARSRAQPQPGFVRLMGYLPDVRARLRVLDVGAGEGRFGRYLLEKRVLGAYTAVDFSRELLARAEAAVPGDYYQRDLSRPGALDGLGQFDLVVCLAVLQHIPGRAARARLLREMGERLADDGRLFLSTWQFMDSSRQRRKLRPWSEVGLSEADVEETDHLLSWGRGGDGRRYVCYIDAAETAVLVAEAGLEVVGQFRDDGREGNLNLYTVLQRV